MNRVNNPESMERKQAVSLAMLLVEFEIENPQTLPCPPDWQNELKSALFQLQALHKELSPNCNLAGIGTPFSKNCGRAGKRGRKRKKPI